MVCLKMTVLLKSFS